MSEEFEVPSELAPGWVIEWIHKPIGGGNGFIKILDGDGEAFDCHEIKNGHPRDVFDFVALAQNMASKKGFFVSCNPMAQEIVLESNTAIRCLVITGC